MMAKPASSFITDDNVSALLETSRAAGIFITEAELRELLEAFADDPCARCTVLLRHHHLRDHEFVADAADADLSERN